MDFSQNQFPLNLSRLSQAADFYVNQLIIPFIFSYTLKVSLHIVAT